MICEHREVLAYLSTKSIVTEGHPQEHYEIQQ